MRPVLIAFIPLLGIASPAFATDRTTISLRVGYGTPYDATDSATFDSGGDLGLSVARGIHEGVQAVLSADYRRFEGPVTRWFEGPALDVTFELIPFGFGFRVQPLHRNWYVEQKLLLAVTHIVSSPAEAFESEDGAATGSRTVVQPGLSFDFGVLLPIVDQLALDVGVGYLLTDDIDAGGLPGLAYWPFRGFSQAQIRGGFEWRFVE